MCYLSIQFLDSERSDECIDFRMIITSRNNAPISNFGGGFRSKITFSNSFQKNLEKQKKKKKMTGKREFLRKTNSERRNECIDFTIIITSQNNVPISTFWGGFRWKSEYPWCIKEVKSEHFP
ncbi:Uncharacterized protein FWK35_00021690, partial [Aphis craccivora]